MAYRSLSPWRFRAVAQAVWTRKLQDQVGLYRGENSSWLNREVCEDTSAIQCLFGHLRTNSDPDSDPDSDPVRSSNPPVIQYESSIFQ